MTSQQYESYIRFYRKHPEWIPILTIANKLLTMIGYITYPLLIAYLFYYQHPRLFPYIIGPGISFLAVSIYRKLRNKPRPYEDPSIDTIKRRDKKGQSFPSRHVFSYYLIATILFSLFPIPGILMMITGLFLAYVRVIMGVHYPLDVIAGAIIGIVCGIFCILI